MFLDAMQSAQDAVKKDLDDAQRSVKRTLEQNSSRVEALEAALKRSNAAKEAYKSRAVAAEESLAAIKLKQQAAEEATQANLPGRGRARRYLREGLQIRNFKANGIKGNSIDHSSQNVKGDWVASEDEAGHDGSRPQGAP
eukprot:scaffold647820_cov50-Prasinocladus_malaysianus.AAC.1